MAKKKGIDVLRQEIDSIDDRLLELLNERALLAVEAGKAKNASNKEIYAPGRETKIYKRLTSNNNGPLPDQAVRNVFREIISASRSLEKKMKIAFLGPPATFTHQASMEHFGLSAEYVAKKDIADVFSDVEKGKADYGVVPIENSSEGVVSNTLDMFVSSELKICAEKLIEVSLSLLNKSGNAADIKKVCSHPHAIAQCRRWLKENLTDVPTVEVSSTAMAAKEASVDDGTAAIASTAAASLYGLEVVEGKIEDNPNNLTRFLVLGREGAKKSGHDKTSVMFDVKDSPGALFDILKPFASRGVNLTKIESRPVKNKAWAYIFFLDIEGHATEKKVGEAIAELEGYCSFVKVLGSYPKSHGI